jgi:hypothetical protein
LPSPFFLTACREAAGYTGRSTAGERSARARCRLVETIPCIHLRTGMMEEWVQDEGVDASSSAASTGRGGIDLGGE